MNEEQLKILYDSYASKNGFEDFGEFKSLMADESARGVFFEDANSELGFKDINEFNSLLGVGGGSMGKPNIPSASSGGESPSSPSKGFDTDYYIRQAPSATEIDTTLSQADPTKKEDVKNKFIGKTAEYYNNAYSNVTKELEGLEADVDSIKERRAELEIMRDRLAKTPKPMPSVGAGYMGAVEGYNQNIQAINDEINGLNTAVNDYNKAVKEKSLERYTIAQDKVAYDSYMKQQESDAIKGMWDEMPLTGFVGGKVMGGFLYGMNQIAGSVLMDAATKGPTMTQAEINNIESEELRILFQENRNKELKEAKKFYDKALEFQESSEAAKRKFGLVPNLQEIESPLDVVNFAVTSMSEQFPQIPLAVATLGLGTLSQTSGHIMGDIIKEKVSEYEKEGKTPEEAFKLAVESDDINRAAVTGASIAVTGLDLLGATKLIGGIGKKAAAESLKDSFISAGAKTFIKGTTTEVATEVAQEYIEAEGKGLAVGKDFLEGASEITVDDALNIVAKTLFGAGGFSAVNAYTEQGRVNKENAEMLRKAAENEATRTLLEERITAQKIAGEITEEQANERIAQLADDIEIMSSIPKGVAQEDMLEAYDLVKKYNQAKADQEQASSAFRGLYNEEIKGYENKLQSLVGKKQEQQSETSTTSKKDSGDVQEPPTGDGTVQEEIVEEKQLEQDAKKQQSLEMREQGEPQETEGTSDSNLSEVNKTGLQDGAKEAIATLKLKPEQEITYKSGEETLSGKVVEDLGETISIETPNGSEVIIDKSNLVSRPKPPKQKSVSVESETQGLTPKQQAKQGVTEIVESYKGRIKEIRSTMNERIKQAKQVARDKAKAIRDTQKLLDDFVKETIPQTEKISRGLARKIANARTDKAVENAMDAIENYLEKSAISKEKNNIRENQKKVAKKLKSTSEYTNKERVVSEFLAGLDLNSISDINTLSEIARVMNDLANKPIANVREAEIKAIKLEPTEKPPKDVKPDDIKAIVDRSFDKERTIQQRAKDINKAVKEVDRLMADGKDVTELESVLNDSINSLNEDTKSEIAELNKESDSLLKSADLSELSPAQKEKVNSLINAGRRKDYRSAKLLNDIAIELSFGYAPIKNIQEYINSEYSRRNADDISSKIDASQSKRKTPIQKKLTEGFFSPIIPNLFKKYGIDNKSLQDVIDDLRLSDWFRWDDYFGLGASKPLYIAVISPLERAVTQHTESFRNTIGSLSKLGRPLKSDAQTKIVMAMVQGYWDNYRSGDDYWGKLLKDPKFKKYHKDRHDFLSKLYDSMPKKNGKIDYDGYLGSLDGIEKKTYDWIVKNNETMKDLQRTANESRGQLFEEIDSRYYIPMRRKKDAPMVSMDGDGYVDNLFKMFSDGVSKLKSDTGINRTDVSIDDLNTNLYKLIQDQVFQTTRDYYVTEAARRSAQTLGKATSATKDLDAKKYLTAMNRALKSRMAEQFGRSKGSGLGVINVVLRAMYQYVLSGFRIPIEAGAETIRGLGATDPKYWGDAARLRASSIENESLRTLLKSTNSPFISQMYFEMIEGGNEFDFNATPTKATYNLLKAYKGLGELNEKAIASSDAMTFGFTWLPSFLKAFNEKTGKDFDVNGFLNNADKYINDNLSDIKLAASVADNHTQTIKGAKTKMGKREAVKILPFKIKGSSGVRYDMVSSSSSAGRLVTTLQNFAHLESFNIIRNINSAIYQENKTRGAALGEIGSAFISGTFYGLATSLAFTVKQMLLGDDDEKKEAEEEMKRLTSAEGVYDSAISNALFLAGGQYGNISKTAILMAAGLYDSYLKKSLPSSEYKKKSKELSEITRNRYFSEPIKFGGYNSEQKILNALAPFVGRSILVVTKNMAQLGSDAYDFVTGDGDTVKALRMLNSLSVLGLMTMGMSHPFAKEIEYALRDRDKKKNKSKEGSFRILN